MICDDSWFRLTTVFCAAAGGGYALTAVTTAAATIALPASFLMFESFMLSTFSDIGVTVLIAFGLRTIERGFDEPVGRRLVGAGAVGAIDCSAAAERRGAFATGACDSRAIAADGGAIT